MKKSGKVWLAGAGPGDAGLLTIKTKNLLEQADVIVYDSLISTEIMSMIPKDKECIFVGKRAGNHAVPQEGINQILLDKALEGKEVLRLKGGDPFVFGRGGEELELLVENEIPFEIVPGITSAVAVAAYAGIPITHRDYTSSFHVVTGHAKKGEETKIDYEALVRTKGTLIFLMGISNMPDICKGLAAAGMRPDMPAAVLEKGTTSRQRAIVSDIEHLVEAAEREKVETPAIIVVGEVCGLEKSFAWTKKRPLNGRQFLITRPKQNVSQFAKKLRSCGAQVLEVPSIATKPIEQTEELKAALLERSEGECWLVFSSPIGVDTFFELLWKLELDMRSIMRQKGQLKFAAIGSATAAQLRKFGFVADAVPKVYNAKNLGELLAKEAAPGSEVLLVRAKEGSKELIPPLEAAGLSVKDIATYETMYEKNEVLSELVKKAFLNGEIDAVTFTSASTVKGFVNTFETLDFSKVRAICIGEQTAQEAMRYSMSVQIAKEATMDSMLELMIEEFGPGR